MLKLLDKHKLGKYSDKFRSRGVNVELLLEACTDDSKLTDLGVNRIDGKKMKKAFSASK